jgi:hypothetical protein
MLSRTAHCSPSLAHPAKLHLARLVRLRVRRVFCWPRFPWAIPFPPPPPPPRPGRCSAASQVLRDRRTSHDGASRGLRPWPSPRAPPHHQDGRVIVGPPGSRVRRLRACPGSSTPRGPPTARESAAGDTAFRVQDGVGTLDERIARLNSPAYAYPFRRFTTALTDDSARLRPPSVASSSMSDPLILFSGPVYPGAPYTLPGTDPPASP